MNALLLILSLLVCFQAMAEEKQMYRWRDANNELHVGQIPPTDLPFETITVSSSRRSAKELATSNALPPASDQALSEADRLSKCERVKENINILSQDKPVYMQTENGGSELLDKTALAEQLALAQKQVDYYCHN